MLATVAVAYGETGDFAEAIRWVEKVVALYPQCEAYQRYFKKVRAGQPVHQEADAQGDVAARP